MSPVSTSLGANLLLVIYRKKGNEMYSHIRTHSTFILKINQKFLESKKKASRKGEKVKSESATLLVTMTTMVLDMKKDVWKEEALVVGKEAPFSFPSVVVVVTTVRRKSYL